MPSGFAAASAASPLIQKCACTTSGRSASHARRSAAANARHVRVDRVLGNRSRRARVDVLDDDARTHHDALRQRGIVAPRVDGDRVAEHGERARERGDVHVLAARVDAAQRRERARVLGYHRYAHAGTSANSASQSRRKRSKPYRSQRVGACAQAVGACAVRDRRVATQRVAQALDVGRQHAAAGGHRFDRFRRRERDDGHAQVHRLDQREAQGRPPHRVQVHAPPRHLRVQHALRRILDAAERARVDAEKIERDRASEALEQIGSRDARAAARFVDRDRGARQLAGEPVAGIDNAVLDHAHRRRTAIPEESVEVRDVHDREVRPVGERMTHVADAPLRSVVLEEDRAHVASGRAPEPRGGEVELVRTLQ